jgi:hypothetical protein
VHPYVGDASGLLDDIVTAISKTIQTSGCKAAAEFATGVYKRLAVQDPLSADDVKKKFSGSSEIAKCKFNWDA